MKFSKFFSLLMTLIMVVSMLSVSAFAADGDHEHVWNIVPEQAPTCTKEGYGKKMCNNCTAYEEVTLPATGHSGLVTIKHPTCTEKGGIVGICNICGETFWNAEYEAKGHTEVVDEAVAATCTTAGKTEGKHCSVCKVVLVAQEEVAAGHDWNIVPDQAPTCTEDGVGTKMCNNCTAFEKNVKLEALGHTEVVDEAVAATCTTAGKTEGKHCSVCEVVLVAQEEVAAGHDWQVGSEKAPTCTEDGYEILYCAKGGTECGTKENVLPATGHTAAEAVKENEKAATCEAAGSYDEVISCSACKEELSRETKTVAALGHKWDAGVVTKKPTATAKGETTYTCQNDKAHTKTAEIAALGTSGDAGLDNVPKTGDASGIFMFGGMMIVALFGAIVTFFSAKKRNNH